ncbi:MAG: polyprenyl synthetase family protein [Micrococcales bacterium]|nr:polyprenyl synthetase family protein [Micrococcales bacterium]
MSTPRTAATLARRSSLGASLGLGEKLFASTEEKQFLDAIDRGLEEVESGLVEQIGFSDALADATTRYLLDAGGKRIRPTLALVTAQLGAGATPEVIVAAQAVELTHLASLYHDDVMDSADTRRGVPSAQRVWGNSVAILSGDLLFARAAQLVAELGIETVRLQSRTFERLCLGQLHETTGPEPGEDAVAHYLQVLADKTGSLIAASARSGVLHSGAPREYADAVSLFGERVGIAFQLADDVLDLSSRPDQTGKVPGTDLRAGVPTLPLIHLRRSAVTDAGSAALLARLELAAAASPAEPGADPGADAELADAIAELREHPVTDQTVAEARRWAALAVDALEPLPRGPVRKALSRFADAVVERSS